MSDSPDQYGKRDAQKRFEAALRGARVIGPKPMSKIAPKRNLGKADIKPTKAKRKPGK